MSFPIAIGSKSVSLYPVSLPDPLEEYADDRSTILIPSLIAQIDIDDGRGTSVFITAGTDSSMYNVSNNNIYQQQDLQAVATLSYYDMLRLDNGDCEYTIAEIKIQIAPLGESFSFSKYRESIHRIRLPHTSERERSLKEKQNGAEVVTNHQSVERLNLRPHKVSPEIQFSPDRRFLTFLIPNRPLTSHSDDNLEQETSVIVFQLRRPQSDFKQQNLPIIPSYVHKATFASSSVAAAASTLTGDSFEQYVPIATNPKLVHIIQYESVNDDEKNNTTQQVSRRDLLNVCSIGKLSTSIHSQGDNSKNSSNGAQLLTSSASSSVLLLGCFDGSLRIASFRTTFVEQELLYKSHDISSVVEIDHVTEYLSETNTLLGRLVLLFQDGLVRVFRSQIHILHQLKIDLQETHIFRQLATTSMQQGCYYSSVKLISCSFLALASIQQSALSLDSTTGTTTIEVLGLYDGGRYALLSQIELSADRLIENSHTTYTVLNRNDTNVNSFPRIKKQGGTNLSLKHSNNKQRSLSIEYDTTTDCVAISGYVNSPSKSKESTLFHFACIWHWRSNTQGLTIVPSLEYGMSSASGSLSGSSKFCTFMQTCRLFFATDATFGRKIVHILSWRSNSSNLIQARKELYNTGFLSPPRNLSTHHTCLKRPSSLFLSATTVAYPLVTRISTRANFELEWLESMIPKAYLGMHGKPRTATIGEKMGRSIAVAGVRGLCTLDCFDRFYGDALLKKSLVTFPDLNEDATVMGKHWKPTIGGPRWHLFGNATVEHSFRVVSMSWWESSDSLRFTSSNLNPAKRVDILIAVIEVLTGSGQGYYLSGWSSRDLSVDGQLLIDSLDYYSRGATLGNTWGVPISPDFVPGALDLLELRNKYSHPRKASVLLTDKSYQTRFLLYCLQTVDFQSQQNASNGIRKHFEVVVHLIVSDTAGSPADLFLASSSFFVPTRKQSNKQKTCDVITVDYCITIGVARRNSVEFDALAYSNHGILTIGKVLSSTQNNEEQFPFIRYWLGDVVLQMQLSSNSPPMDLNVWILQLADGRLRSWFVPSVLKRSDIVCLLGSFEDLMVNSKAMGKQFVHPKSLTLGYTCDAGSSETWMQQTSKGTRYDYLVGPVPMTSFGCIIGIAQSCKKFHRSLGEDFEKFIFRQDFLDHEVFCPSDFVLYPPALVPSLYSYIHDLAANSCSFTQSLSLLRRHLWRKVSSNVERFNLMMSLKIIILRSIEKVSALSCRESVQRTPYAIERKMYALLIDTVRMHTTQIQFASIFLKLGRQLEPSCFKYLLPLPASPFSKSKNTETLEFLLSELLDQGSIAMTATALPLFSNKECTKAMCGTLFDHCLKAFDFSFDHISSALFLCTSEEKKIVGDVFRYALKLDDSFPEKGTDSEDDEETVESSIRNSYLFCGIPRLLGRVAQTNTIETKPLVKFSLVQKNGQSNENSGSYSMSNTNKKTISHVNGSAAQSRNVAAVACCYILASVFECNKECQEFSWRRVSAVASLLVDRNDSGLQKVQKTDFSILNETINENTQMNDVIRFIKHHINECSNQLDSAGAGIILDLVQTLLSSAKKDLDMEILKLLLLSVIVGHVSDRITEVFADEPKDTLIWKIYLNVRFELSVQR